MSLWPDLLSSALVGLDKRACAAPAQDGPLATVLPTGELDADGLMTAAAAIALARRAGLRPVRGLEPILAPAEQRAVASRGAGARLARL
ncbi:hypothetical protein, partial [Allorhizocola rhizosphaerae]|uniref:DUF5691 domain-containing protein n=1 Tax=Allorhizocola rhizosphaerae TaxID=1872709 RepID=UPI001B8BA5BB